MFVWIFDIILKMQVYSHMMCNLVYNAQKYINNV